MARGTKIKRYWIRPRPSIRRFRRFYAERATRLLRSFIAFFSRVPKIVSEMMLRPPEFFADLNCDQIVDAITAGKDEYNLKPFFYACLQRIDAIRYRHEIMQDLEQPSLYDRVTFFASKMREVREHLFRARKAYYPEQKQAWFLDAADIYCETIFFRDELAFRI